MVKQVRVGGVQTEESDTLPLSTSFCVTVNVPVKVADWPGASEPDPQVPAPTETDWHVGPDVKTSPATDCVSVTETFVSVVFPVLETTNW